MEHLVSREKLMKVASLAFSILMCAASLFSQSFRDEFSEPSLGGGWGFVRNLDQSCWSLTENKGFLRLKGSTVTLDDTEVSPVYVGQKIGRTNFEATTQVEFDPRSDLETAGMSLRRNERHHYEIGIRKKGNGRELYLRFAIGTNRQVSRTYPIPNSSIKLKISGFPEYYRFAFAMGNEGFTEIGGFETKYLEDKDGLENVQIGLFASGTGTNSIAPADFDWFDFNADPKDPYADVVMTDPALPKGWTIFSVAGAEKGIIKKYPFIYRPSSIVPEGVEFQKGLPYASYGERTMRVDLFRPKRKGKFPAVIIVHGGAWITGHHTMENPLAIALAERGYVAVTVEHRLANEKKYPAQIHDLKASVRWLRANAKKLGVDQKRIGAVGASSGGHLVALLGATNENPKYEGNGGNERFSSRVQSVVDIDGTATFIDPGNVAKEIKGPWNTNTVLTGFTYAENPEIWREASPIEQVTPKSAPTLFLNSSSFRPFQQREEMAAKLNALRIESQIIVVPDTPHPFWLFRPWFDATVENIDKFFKETMNKR